MSEKLRNSLAIFLACKAAENPNGRPVTISWEAAHQIIEELERQDWTVERLATGAGAVIERERSALIQEVKRD